MSRPTLLHPTLAEASRTRPGVLLALHVVLALVVAAALALADEAITQGEARRALGGLFDGTS